MRYVRFCVVVCSLWLGMTLTHAQQSEATLAAEIDSIVAEMNPPALSVVVLDDDAQPFTAAYGEDISDDTPFISGSLSKSFTALATLQLVESGAIASLDDPLREYLPDFPASDVYEQPITVRHLLNHTSGLPNLIGARLPDAAHNDFAQLPTAFDDDAIERLYAPGSDFTYSNINYSLLGAVIEAASGTSYADYLDAVIFTPLGMSNSTADVQVAKENGLPTGYQTVFVLRQMRPTNPTPVDVPSGFVAVSAADMARYLQMLLNGGIYEETRLLTDDSFKTLFTVEQSNYAMGWVSAGEGTWQHYGRTPGFSSMMWLHPERQQAFAIFINDSSADLSSLVDAIQEQLRR